MNAVPELKKSTFYIVNGLVLWLMYFVFRLPIPVVMWYLGKDLREQPATAWVFKDPKHQKAWVVFLFVSGTFLWLLSMMWFQKITAGVLKALVGSSQAKPEGTKDEAKSPGNLKKAKSS